MPIKKPVCHKGKMAWMFSIRGLTFLISLMSVIFWTMYLHWLWIDWEWIWCLAWNMSRLTRLQDQMLSLPLKKLFMQRNYLSMVLSINPHCSSITKKVNNYTCPKETWVSFCISHGLMLHHCYTRLLLAPLIKIKKSVHKINNT